LTTTRAGLDCFSDIAISTIIIIRTTGCVTSGGQACGWNLNWTRPEPGVTAPCNSSSYRPPDETYDNIVAFWNPAEKPQPGQELLFSYRLYWGTRIPLVPPLAQTVATRPGIGGVVGQKPKYFSWRFAVDFAGGELATLPDDAEVEPVITASRGQVEITSARPQKEIKGYRAMFDLRPTDSSMEPTDLRLYLSLNGQPLTETCLYQWTPPSLAERKR
jgi:glucans biosynthesis protein